MQHTLFVQTVI